MPGMITRILQRTSYDFTTVGNGASPGEITIAKNVSAASWEDVLALVRLHAVTYGGGAKITLKFYRSAPTDEDPTLTFRTGSALATVLFQQGTDSAPALGVGDLADVGAFFDVTLTPSQATNGGTFTFALSIDVSMKSS